MYFSALLTLQDRTENHALSVTWAPCTNIFINIIIIIISISETHIHLISPYLVLLRIFEVFFFMRELVILLICLTSIKLYLKRDKKNGGDEGHVIRSHAEFHILSIYVMLFGILALVERKFWNVPFNTGTSKIRIRPSITRGGFKGTLQQEESVLSL